MRNSFIRSCSSLITTGISARVRMTNEDRISRIGKINKRYFCCIWYYIIDYSIQHNLYFILCRYTKCNFRLKWYRIINMQTVSFFYSLLLSWKYVNSFPLNVVIVLLQWEVIVRLDFCFFLVDYDMWGQTIVSLLADYFEN